MKRCLIVMVMAILAFGSVAQAETVVIQDLTELGDDPGIQDAELMLPTPYDPWTGHGRPEVGDQNMGIADEFTLFSDVGPFQNTSIAANHQLFKFDVSALEGKDIINADFVYNIHPRNRRKSCCIPIAERKLSRLLPGKDWIEGVGSGDPALDGEVTWNSRKHYLNPPWDPGDPGYPPALPGDPGWDPAALTWLGGATSPDEIDMDSTVTIPYIAPLGKGQIRTETINVTELVQAWADGAENNGMVFWGGYVPAAETCERHFRLFVMKLMTSEAPPDQRFVRDGETYYTTLEDRPALVVEIPLEVNVDILPSDDLNLFTVNTQGKGRLPIAILGSEDYDINQIDIDTISVAGVVTPVKEPKAEDDVNGDGLIDLVVHVSRRELILALGLDLLEPGAEVPVSVSGSLLDDGGPFVGTDTVVLVARED